MSRVLASFLCGAIVGGHLVLAGFAWALHWNAYNCLALTFVGLVLLATAIAALGEPA